MTTTAEIAGEERGRDHGLVRAMGVTAFAAAITNEVVGSGIYRLPASVAGIAGAAAPLAYLACLFAMGAVVLCFAEAGSRVPTSGGPYGYVEAAFGKGPGFVAGVLLWLAAVLAAGGVSGALADTAASVFTVLGEPIARAALIVAVLGGMAWLNVIGVDLAAKVLGWATLVKLLPLALFIIVGAVGVALGYGTPGTATAQGNEMSLGRAIILALFAFQGMETPLSASGEVRDPARSVPRALLLAMCSIGVAYVLIQLIAEALLGPNLPLSRTPLADALGVIDPRWRAPLLAGAFFSMMIWLGSDFLGAPRMLFAFARDGVLPPVLGRVHSRWRTPHVGILVHFLVALGLALSGTYEQLAVLSSLAVAPLYAAGCAAAFVLRRRNVAIMGTPFRAPALPLVAAIGIGAMAAMVVQGEWSEIGALIAVIAVSALAYPILRRRHRA